MKTITLPFNFVREAHKSACSDWKTRIEEYVPELRKTVLEVGRWVICKRYNLLIYVTDKNNSDFSGYGFNDTHWFEEESGWDSKHFLLSTKEEIAEALINEAKKQGIWDAPIIDTFGLEQKENVNNGAHFNMGANRLRSNFGFIFDNGKWATPLPQIPDDIQSLIDKYGKEELTKILKL